ncbi:MAG: hypothetical protein WDO74_19185 [Pseudomonadota bacterium]
MEAYKELTEQAPALHGQGAGGPASPAEPPQTLVSKSRAKRRASLGAREAPHASRPSARQALQPTARKYVELTRPWHDQITINE